MTQSTPPQRPAHIGREQWDLSPQIQDLQEAILRVVDEAGPALPEDWKTAVIADCVSERESGADGWCAPCKQHLAADPPICPDHDRGDDLAIALRRYLYARQGGLIDADL